MRLSRLRSFAVALCLASTPALAQPVQPEHPQKAAPQDPVGTFADGFSARWIEDRDLVYGPALLDFEVRAYLADRAPHLVPYAEVVSHWAGHYSISPKVLLALVDLRSGVVSTAGRASAIADPSAGLVTGADFGAQVQTLASSLYVDFYAFLEASRSRPTTTNAATFALLNLFRTAAPASFTPAAADDTRGRFLEVYARLFPEPALAAAADLDLTPAAPPANFLQLPWKHNQSWFFNGTHTISGSDPGVRGSIDFSRSWALRWGDDTSTDFVVAAHAGQVTVYSSCELRVTAPNGWSTTYYHLSNIAVANGAQVTANQTLAIYANTLAQALCAGGSSTGPHTHFTLAQNGVFSALDGAQLSNFVVHSGRYSYDSDPAYMWLQSATTGTRYYAYQTAIPSTPAASNVPGTPTNFTASVSGLTLSMGWTAPTTGGAPTGYVLDVATTNTFSPMLIAGLALGAGPTAALNAPPGTVGTFYLRLSAVNANGTSTPSNVVSVTFTPTGTAPGAPGTPTVQVLPSRAIAVSWTPPTTGPAPTGYRAHVTVGGAPMPGSPFGLPALTAVATPGPLPPGNYTIAMSAVAGAVEGALSAATPFVVPGACTAAPAAPTGFAITKLGGLNVRLAWTASAGANTATSYRLQAAVDAGFTAVALDTNVGNITTLDAAGVPATFFVRVFAVNDCGTGAPSNVATVTLP